MFDQLQRDLERGRKVRTYIDPIVLGILAEVAAGKGTISPPTHNNEMGWWQLSTGESYVRVRLMVGGRGPYGVFLWACMIGEGDQSTDETKLAQSLAEETRLYVRRRMHDEWLYYKPTPNLLRFRRWLVGLVTRGR